MATEDRRTTWHSGQPGPGIRLTLSNLRSATDSLRVWGDWFTPGSLATPPVKCAWPSDSDDDCHLGHQGTKLGTAPDTQ